MHILSNQLLSNSAPPLCNQDNQGPDPPPKKKERKRLRNMCTETSTFDINNATQKYKKIIDLAHFKGSGMGYD